MNITDMPTSDPYSGCEGFEELLSNCPRYGLRFIRSGLEYTSQLHHGFVEAPPSRDLDPITQTWFDVWPSLTSRDGWAPPNTGFRPSWDAGGLRQWILGPA